MWTADYLILADAVAVADGKHYIHGAGWDTITAGSFPLNHRFAVAIRLRVPWEDTNMPCQIELDILDADGKSILPDPPGPVRGTINVGRPPHIAPGDEQSIQLAFQLGGVPIPKAGSYVAVLRLNDLEYLRSPFKVRSVPGAAS
jgi:hypothetical protein